MIEYGISFILGCALVLLMNYLGGYTRQKAKNLATKEDIQQITDQVESVKHSYSERITQLQASLETKINRYSFRFQKEFEVLEVLMEQLVEVRDSALSLHPKVDLQPADADQERIKEERLERVFNAQREMYRVRETKRPFYPQNIYDAIYIVEDEAFARAIHYDVGQSHGVEAFRDYWKQVEERRERIIQNAEDAIEKIRDRVIEWEELESSA